MWWYSSPIMMVLEEKYSATKTEKKSLQWTPIDGKTSRLGGLGGMTRLGARDRQGSHVSPSMNEDLVHPRLRKDVPSSGPASASRSYVNCSAKWMTHYVGAVVISHFAITDVICNLVGVLARWDVIPHGLQ